MAAMGQPKTKVADLCRELGVTRQTLYRHVSPAGALREDGVTARKGQQSTLRVFVNDLTKENAPEFDYSSLYEKLRRRPTALWWTFVVSHEVLPNSLPRGDKSFLA